MGVVGWHVVGGEGVATRESEAEIATLAVHSIGNLARATSPHPDGSLGQSKGLSFYCTSMLVYLCTLITTPLSIHPFILG